MRYWVAAPTSSPRAGLEEFDSVLAQESREIKTLISNNKDVVEEFRTIVAQILCEHTPNSAAVILNNGQTGTAFSFNLFLNSGLNTTVAASTRDFPSQFKTIVRNILAIGCGLSLNKEMRDIFIDLVEKIMEPCAAYGWRSNDAEAFFIAVREAWPRLTSLDPTLVRRMHASWYRLTIGIQLTTNRLFNDISVALQIAK